MTLSRFSEIFACYGPLNNSIIVDDEEIYYSGRNYTNCDYLIVGSVRFSWDSNLLRTENCISIAMKPNQLSLNT